MDLSTNKLGSFCSEYNSGYYNYYECRNSIAKQVLILKKQSGTITRTNEVIKTFNNYLLLFKNLHLSFDSFKGAILLWFQKICIYKSMNIENNKNKMILPVKDENR